MDHASHARLRAHHDRTGGTILHTSRINPAKVKPDEVPTCVRAEDRVATPDGAVDCTRHVLRVLDFLGLEAIIPIGGDDTLSYAARLHHEGVRVVGIPKTMETTCLAPITASASPPPSPARWMPGDVPAPVELTG